MKEIIVKVSKDGSSTEITVEGVKGGACADITKNLQAALGQVTDSKKTPDFYLQDCNTVSCEEGGF